MVNGQNPSKMNEQSPNIVEDRLVICIGDIHGYYTKLQNLWSNLESETNPSQFENATIIFLGDYCDRGPDTKRVIEFLVNLPSKYPNQKHVILAGNHEFAFAAFLGVIPGPGEGCKFSDGWKEYAQNEEREGWYVGDGYENMHLQGRRWSGVIKVKFNTAKGIDFKGSLYDAAPTFHSYGVPHASSDLMKAVPDAHKKFLAGLVWVHEEDNVYMETAEGLKRYRLIAVHGGLQQGKSVNEQLKHLHDRGTAIPKIECLSGRKTIWDMPEELKENNTILVSGHHGELHIDGLRLIIDEGGGYEHKPVAAIILPSMKLVRSGTDQ